MSFAMSNIFDDIPERLPSELIDVLAEAGDVRIERIVSRGHASPEDFWYDQSEDEWTMVLRGRARLAMAGEEELVELGPGDWILIPARRRHRVAWTTPDEPTVWLAVFFDRTSAPGRDDRKP